MLPIVFLAMMISAIVAIVTQVFRYKRQANYALERFADALWDATNKLKLVQPESEYEDAIQRSADLRSNELQRLYKQYSVHQDFTYTDAMIDAKWQRLHRKWITSHGYLEQCLMEYELLAKNFNLSLKIFPYRAVAFLFRIKPVILFRT